MSDIVEQLSRALIQATGDNFDTEEAEFYLQTFERAGLTLRDKDADDTDQADHIAALEARNARLEEQVREAYERCAAYIEGKGGVLPGANVFAGLVSGNNQPCMSGDMRDRMHPPVRRRFDDATRTLAQAIRTLTTEQANG